jgi:hypothetical protein
MNKNCNNGAYIIEQVMPKNNSATIYNNKPNDDTVSHFISKKNISFELISKLSGSVTILINSCAVLNFCIDNVNNVKLNSKYNAAISKILSGVHN